MEGSGPRLDAATLTPVVRRALGSATAEVDTWETRPLGAAFNPVTGGLRRVAGTATDRRRPVPWSLVLKVCRDPGGAQEADPRATAYWKREFLVYASGLPERLPPGLRAPRCFGADERPGGEFWLWLEELADAHGSPWPLARYGLAARHAGRFNGAYLTGWPLPAVPWLGAGVARTWVETFGRPAERLEELAEHPFVRREWPDAGSGARAARLWRDRELFLAALARLPQTVCHLDLFRLNLFAVRTPDGGEETAAIDWAFLGTAAVGEELAPLVCTSPVMADADPDRVRELGELAFEQYLAGLRDAGWRGDARLVRLGYAAGVMRYAPVSFALLAILDPEFAPRVERAWGHPFDEALDRFAAVHRYLLDLTDEARNLIAAP